MVGNANDKAARVTVTAGGLEYSIPVAANRQAMLVTKGGKLVGLEAQGEVSREGVALFSANRHFFAVSLDGRDLADSREIAMVGLRAGKFSIGRTGLRSEAGDVRGGTWHVLKDLGGSVNVPASLAGDVILVAPPGQDGARERERGGAAGAVGRHALFRGFGCALSCVCSPGRGVVRGAWAEHHRDLETATLEH